jgi:hypothetical protein
VGSDQHVRVSPDDVVSVQAPRPQKKREGRGVAWLPVWGPVFLKEGLSVKISSICIKNT